MATLTYQNKAYEVSGLPYPMRLTKKQAQGLVWLYKAFTEDKQPWELGLVHPMTLRALEKLGLATYNPTGGLYGGMWYLAGPSKILGKFLSENLFTKIYG